MGATFVEADSAPAHAVLDELVLFLGLNIVSLEGRKRLVQIFDADQVPFTTDGVNSASLA